MTNSELNNYNTVQTTYTFKDIESHDENYAEVFMDQLRCISNSEVLYEEYAIQAFFNPDDLWDPKILNEEAGERFPLGSLANYRNKYLVSTVTVTKSQIK